MNKIKQSSNKKEKKAQISGGRTERREKKRKINQNKIKERKEKALNNCFRNGRREEDNIISE
jgi:hypothetical protein